MDDVNTKLAHALQQQHASITKARKTVFMALQNAEPLTMQQLVSRCEHVIDRASVYRTITLFERLGVVQRLQIGWKYKVELSNAYQHHHHHLTCLQCGSITPLPEDALLEKQLTKLAKLHYFVAHDHQIEIRGICTMCRQ